MSTYRPTFAGALFVALLVAASCGDNSPTAPDSLASSSTSSSTNTGGAGSGGGTNTTSALAYTQDIKSILDADCTRCHADGRADGGVNLSTYANVMRHVTPGSANSRLVRSTASNGSMYRYWSGDAASKANRIRSWVVDFQAAESR